MCSLGYLLASCSGSYDSHDEMIVYDMELFESQERVEAAATVVCFVKQSKVLVKKAGGSRSTHCTT